MNEAYFEIMVKKQSSPFRKILTPVSLILAVFFTVLGIMGIFPALFLGLACIVAWYFLNLYRTIEYEYLYVDKELQIDRILGKTKRKRMEILDISQLEILAPEKSHQWDSYRAKKLTKKDYTSGSQEYSKNVYVLVISGNVIYFEPTLELVKAIQMIAPRKVFTY
ncbi:MAG: hypothetical protein IKW28_09640 [Lachnospiraceae bacterium]|nr:hypothetical protein [Lachnospiraceae bacterium]